jgi:BASS family bile acid:Na+ symporter
MEVATLIDVGIPALVVFLMGLVGLNLEVADLRRVLERPRFVAAVLVVQPLLLPLVAGAAGWLVGARPLVLVALVLIGACPAGVLSNVYTLLAGGNVALSITLTAAGTVASAATLPLAFGFGLSAFPGLEAKAVGVPFVRTLVELLLTVVLPVGCGMAARPAVARRAGLERGLQTAATLGTLTLAGILLVAEWDVITHSLAHLAAAGAIFSVAALATGYRLAAALATHPADRVAVAFELPARNLGVAAFVGVHGLGQPEIAGLAAALFVIQVPLMLLAVVTLRRLQPRTPVPVDPAASDPA